MAGAIIGASTEVQWLSESLCGHKGIFGGGGRCGPNFSYAHPGQGGQRILLLAELEAEAEAEEKMEVVLNTKELK